MAIPVVAILDMSDVNDWVGEMWQETKIFSSDQPIGDVLKWAFPHSDRRKKSNRRLQITIPDSN